jgi:pimeloyl-ACP methyl ester carboxylesterase
LTSALANIRAETLILVGGHCWICPVVISEHLHAKIPSSRLEMFERSGHFPWIEEPERFFPEIIGFPGVGSSISAGTNERSISVAYADRRGTRSVDEGRSGRVNALY